MSTKYNQIGKNEKTAEDKQRDSLLEKVEKRNKVTHFI